MSNNFTDPTMLRREAESHLAHTLTTESELFSNQKLLHELQVHQVQLEMQNCELRRMQLALEESRDSYADLYNNAPVAYLTLTHNGFIDSINFIARELLGTEHSALQSRRFAAFVATKDSDSWHVFFAKAIKLGHRMSIELKLNAANGSEFPAQLDCVCINSMLRITLIDLTKAKQAEAVLHQAEKMALMSAESIQTARVQKEALNRLQKIANQLPGMVFQYCIHVDGSSHFLYVSDAIQDLYGFAPEDVYEDASKLLSVIHPDDYVVLMAAFQKATLDLCHFNSEYRMMVDDGSVRWLQCNALPERHANESTLWHGFVSDITERKLAEHQMRFQASLLNAVGQAIIATDSLGKITFINSFAESLYGWGSNEAVGRCILEVTDPQMSRGQAEKIMADLARGSTWTGEMMVKHRDGTTFLVEINQTQIFDDKGKVLGIIGVSSDISRRKQIDEELLESNRMLAFSMQYGHMGSWRLNLADHSSKHTLAHDRIFGYESQLTEWSYETFLDHVIPEDRFEVNRQFQKATLTQEDWNIECRICRADGELRWLLIAGGYHKDHQSAESSMYGIVKDITERKCLDQQLHQKNADLEIAKYLAEEASLAKSEFLSRMSHELRTPLNAILGYAQLLEVGTPPLTETQHKRIKPIINAGWYLLELINEILDLDAIESGNLGLLPESLSLQDILLECQSLVQTQAEQEDIQLNFIQCDSSWTIYADKTRIKQLLLNLLSNAIKYNREHGSVTVQCIQTSEYLHICIKDNGEGLTAEQLAELFKPFNRLGQELSDKQGTGIGLVVTKALVEKMGGTISVESTVGVGSEFCVNLLRNDRRIKLRTKAKHGRLE